MANVFSSSGCSVNFGHCVSSCFPIGIRVTIYKIVNSKSFIWLLSAMRINQTRLMEWLILVIPVSVFSSNLICVMVIFGGPASVVKQFCSFVVAADASGGSWSLINSHLFIKFAFFSGQLNVRASLCSGLRV